MDSDDERDTRNVMSRSEHAREMDFRMREASTEFNQYATHKSVSQNMLNVSTIQGLLVTLVNMFYQNKKLGTAFTGFQIALIVLIAISISLQFIIFVLLVILAKAKEANQKISDMNTTVTTLSGLLLIVTSAISIIATYIPQEVPSTNSTAA